MKKCEIFINSIGNYHEWNTFIISNNILRKRRGSCCKVLELKDTVNVEDFEKFVIENLIQHLKGLFRLKTIYF
ncbi:MAG: hypothetical protein CM15mP64_7470 [Candidatus Neomarinimicrobiota bacterium]|nr:MAG: hypothetical protein CM15mP64_7470 [Candidatus Neomarinimicrobiota bacterium]